MKKIVLTGALAISLLGCQSEESESLTTNDGPVAVEFIEIGNNELVGSENFSASALVIDNEADWNALKAQMDIYNPYSESFTEADIDFSAYKVIAVIDELRYSAGFDITITSITETDRELVVDIQHSDGGPGSFATVMTQPFHIVKIPQTNLPIVFE